ncbi:EAL domain-containing protein [Geomonas sp. Red69]|uniref:EAL domain-containing protein n=1 Tax=Geomonas diazotrophica TaxID=2843197 RepID=A0ABX8JPT7_9BACT|nr:MULTISPECIES: EAL domain-containing protein [Geomonas]MBU5637113.1 EAL domain-containing protein [Geomonas diazotrophica]QWV99412.1 EAL domain-containing protein [Geomonas nitrogeniifigens]
MISDHQNSFPHTGSVKTILTRSVITVLVWTLLLSLAVWWNVRVAYQQAFELARTQAEIALAKDLAFRKWASKRGGIYMEQGPLVSPSPFLNHVPDRDLETTGGVQLTLKNPAMIMNEITREAPQFYGINTRITSRLYINPVDAPDEWERTALFIVEGTRETYYTATLIDGKPHLRMMQPMIMEQSCIKCHAWTGIKVGELRGGTDVSIPLAPFYAAAGKQARGVAASHGAIWLLGLVSIGFITRRTMIVEVERSHQEAQLKEKNLELQDSKQYLLTIIEFLPDATLIIDNSGRVVGWNRELTRLTGVAPESMIGRGGLEYAIPFYGHRRPLLIDLALNPAVDSEGRYEGFVRNGDIVQGECYAPRLGAAPAHLTSSASLLRNSKGEVIGAIECIRDTTEQMKTQKRIKLLAKIFNESGEAIVITDSENRIIETNKAFTQFTGYSHEEALGKNPRVLKSGIEDKKFYENMWRSILETNYWQGEIWDKRKDGTLYPKWLTITAIRDPDNTITNYFATFSDITLRKEAEKRIEQLAHTDTLTSLPNRHTLVERLTQALEQAKRGEHMLAVLFVDLDRFKMINDTLGHHVGDLLLMEVASRLKGSLRAEDVVARFGGDEFVVVQPRIRSQVEPAHLAEKILKTVAAPYFLDNNTVYTSPSIGISVFPSDGMTVAELFKNADAAMYHAKAAGRNTYQMFTSEMHTAARQRLAIENSLRSAVANDQFVLHYQPQVEPASGRLVGLEALVRWQNPDDGLVFPDRFIPVAEETGLILEIGRHVFEKACQQAVRWREAGLPPVKIAVNLSARQLRQPDLPEMLSEIMKNCGADPGMIELEVTESMTMERPVESVRILGALKAMGIGLAIDDFGTGYSSLSYLKLFPVDKLKIDRSFVKDIEVDPDDAAIASATIAMAHTLGKKVVAEGVETEAQLEFLVRHGCDIIQGYLFSKPLSAEDAELYQAKLAERTV